MAWGPREGGNREEGGEERTGGEKAQGRGRRREGEEEEQEGRKRSKEKRGRWQLIELSAAFRHVEGSILLAHGGHGPLQHQLHPLWQAQDLVCPFASRSMSVRLPLGLCPSVCLSVYVCVVWGPGQHRNTPVFV